MGGAHSSCEVDHAAGDRIRGGASVLQWIRGYFRTTQPSGGPNANQIIIYGMTIHVTLSLYVHGKKGCTNVMLDQAWQALGCPAIVWTPYCCDGIVVAAAAPYGLDWRG